MTVLTMILSARAGLLMLDAPSHPYLAYRSGVPLTAAVWPYVLAHDSGFAVGSSRLPAGSRRAEGGFAH